MKSVFFRHQCLLMFFFCWVSSFPLYADAEITTLNESVERALNYSPQLQAMTHDYEAIKYDLKQSRARYLPSVDLLSGYGLEQYSDYTTRQSGADPSNTDWNSRRDLTLTMTQKVYDGGETNSLIFVHKALRDSAHFSILAATQAISLNAINAHLEVHLQRELVALAEKDLKFHQDLHRALSEMAQAGAGNIADVTQTQARMARVQSDLFIHKADLSKAAANYKRVVGSKPGVLAYAEVPEIMPNSLGEALEWTEQGNPELLALDSKLIQADARVALARSTYKPKINIELSSGYRDRLHGDPSWQYTNDAMLMLRWNLFNGGQDKAGEDAALSRKYESRSNREDKLVELRESTSAAWATYLSLGRQKESYRDATNYSKKTFDAYFEQFRVSKRSLLDVLITETEYFQSASQLITASVFEIVAAYRILALCGKLQVPGHSEIKKYPEELSRLGQAIVFPSAAQSADFEPLVPSPTPKESPVRLPAVTEEHLASTTEPEATSPAKPALLHSIEIGPCINKLELRKADEILRSHGLDALQTSGTGTVRFTRLLEGIYPLHEGYKRLKELKKTVSAFALPVANKQLAIYVGSFHDSDRAIRHVGLLEQKKIKVTTTAVDIEMQGPMLVVQQIDPKTAETIAEQISRLGLTIKITPNI